MRSFASKLWSRVSGARCVKNEEGVAAIEFAFIAPILILLFIGTLEISYAVAVDRKISRVSSTVADLITQSDEFTKADLNKLLQVTSKIMEPYSEPASNLKISIVSIGIASNKATVEWSHNYNGGTKPVKGSEYTVPSNIKVNDTFLVTAKVELDHKPAFSFVGYKNGSLSFDDTAISLSEEMFLRPRLNTGGVKCTDC